ncbi:MAG: hypothetical protein ACREDR_01615 [Blastocatellia bacterium]
MKKTHTEEFNRTEGCAGRDGSGWVFFEGRGSRVRLQTQGEEGNSITKRWHPGAI